MAWPFQASNTVALVDGGAGVTLPVVMSTDPTAAIMLLVKVRLPLRT